MENSHVIYYFNFYGLCSGFDLGKRRRRGGKISAAIEFEKTKKIFLTYNFDFFFLWAVIPPLTVTSGKPLMVSRGNSFRVECGVPSEIDYCWLRHPNGTTVSVTVPDSAADRKRKTRYRYAGEGLSFGQCHVTVDEASATDTGTWLCALGLRDDRREVYGQVDVTVSGK